MSRHQQPTCPDDLLSDAIAAIRADPSDSLSRIDDLLRDYPSDAKLHFLRGSLLAGDARYEAAHDAIAKAVRLAPDFALARFQLGFLELTSGAPDAAEKTWLPLEKLASNSPYRIFVDGLRSLIRDQFDDAVELLGQGISLNRENAALNNDMQLLIDTIRQQVAGAASDEPISATHMLLQQYSTKGTRH
jgi:Flp pilus assembly protein TadD